MIRKAEIKRKTTETDIVMRLILDNAEKLEINSGEPFFDHMLNSMSRHGRFSLDLRCRGDYEIDAHHSIEDTGICLGKAFRKSLGNMEGVCRFGHDIIPMDDALTMAVIDISGRSYFKYTGIDLKGTIGSYSEELTLEFLRSFASNFGINLHVRVFYGENRHHIHESIFKALGRALFKACSIDISLNNEIQSTKGSLYDNRD